MQCCGLETSALLRFASITSVSTCGLARIGKAFARTSRMAVSVRRRGVAGRSCCLRGHESSGIRRPLELTDSDGPRSLTALRRGFGGGVVEIGAVLGEHARRVSHTVYRTCAYLLECDQQTMSGILVRAIDARDRKPKP